MSNKKETPVSWLKHSIEDLIANDIGSQVKFKNKVNHALQMESQKQQKYDEMVAMLAMLETMYNTWCETGIGDYALDYHMGSIKRIVKEAKEL
jgi:hypothetical protein